MSEPRKYRIHPCDGCGLRHGFLRYHEEGSKRSILLCRTCAAWMNATIRELDHRKYTGRLLAPPYPGGA